MFVHVSLQNNRIKDNTSSFKKLSIYKWRNQGKKGRRELTNFAHDNCALPVHISSSNYNPQNTYVECYIHINKSNYKVIWSTIFTISSLSGWYLGRIFRSNCAISSIQELDCSKLNILGAKLRKLVSGPFYYLSTTSCNKLCRNFSSGVWL